MSTRASQEGASLLTRILLLVLLPVIVLVAVILAIFIAVLLVIGIVIDVLQLVFFGTTGAVGWVAGLVEGIANWFRSLVS